MAKRLSEKKTHILLVDDDEADVELIRRAFAPQAEQVDVTVARSLDEARGCLTQILPDLVFVDLHLPDGSGLSLLEGEQEDQYPLVVMTAHGQDEAAFEALKVGALQYVVKSEAALAELPDKVELALRQWQHVIERRRAEAALRESEKRFRTVVDQAADAMFVHDLDGRIIDVNQQACESLGYSREELLGRRVPNVDAEFGNGDDMKSAWSHLAPKRPITVEGFQQRKDGTTFPVEMRLGLVELGGRRAIIALARDITERKQTEIEMNRLRNLFKNMIDSMPSILVGVNSEGRVTHWNVEAQRVTGVSAEDAPGRMLFDVFPQLSVEMGKIRRAIREQKPQKASKVPTEVDSGVRFSDLTVYPLVANDIEGAVIRVDDVTERVRLEEMMIQSEKMLSVGGLAAGMAHEINNPLAGILQNAQVMRNRLTGDLPKNRRTAEACGITMEAITAYIEERGIPAMIEAIMDSGRRAAQIVDNMLSFSRKSDSHFAPHDLAELLEKTVDLASNDYDLKKKYDFRRIEVVREYDADTPKVACEASKIQQVFLNLLKNGAEAMAGNKGEAPEGKAAPERSRFILRVAPDADMARVEIQDNGPGMDEATRKRVFEPFFTTKDVGVGTGLGLSVSYFIVAENHGGTMAVESTPGNGAKFIIRLPLERRAP